MAKKQKKGTVAICTCGSRKENHVNGEGPNENENSKCKKFKWGLDVEDISLSDNP